MGKPHKEIAQFLVAGGDDANISEAQLVKVCVCVGDGGRRGGGSHARMPPVATCDERHGVALTMSRAGLVDFFAWALPGQGLAQKSKQLLATLETFVDPQTNEVTAEAIKAQEVPTALARFFYNLAVAEGRTSR